MGESSARMTSYGTRTGLVARLVYEPGENGKLLGILDRTNRQVVWFEYDGGGALRAARDLTGRRVEYTYTDGRLSRVKDLLGNDSLYTYDPKGRLTRLVDAAGRERLLAYDSYGSVASVLDSQGNGFFFDYDFDSGKKEAYARVRTSARRVKEVWFDRDWEVKRVDLNGRTIKRIVKDGRAAIIRETTTSNDGRPLTGLVFSAYSSFPRKRLIARSADREEL